MRMDEHVSPHGVRLKFKTSLKITKLSAKHHLNLNTLLRLTTSQLTHLPGCQRPYHPFISLYGHFRTTTPMLRPAVSPSTLVLPFRHLLAVLTAISRYSSAALVKETAARSEIPQRRSLERQYQRQPRLVRSLHAHPTVRDRRLHPLAQLQRSRSSVASWWKRRRITKAEPRRSSSGNTPPEETILSKYLKNPNLRACRPNLTGGLSSITVVLTAKDVNVEGFCMNRCGSHGSSVSTSRRAARQR
ncbi:Phosphate-induced protein 1 protein [Raphanus sativus]|nr:Phosphate-induced protein 1 protein [Raphanus sativus]